MSQQTVVLFGDSILDNAPYTAPEPDTTAHLERLLGEDWRVHRLARDGATMSDVRSQLEQLAEAPDVGVLSVGGNDVLKHVGLLERRGVTTAEIFEELLRIAEAFERSYEEVAKAVSDRVGRSLVCTIYEVPLEPPALARLARVPLAVLNDRIIQAAARLGSDVLDLRAVCTDPEDFVLQIEPSATGAAKVAGAIARAVQGTPPPRSGRVFATDWP